MRTWQRVAAACAVLFGTASVWAGDLHVASGGNDTWSGRSAQPNAAKTDGPLATLEGARDAARRVGTGEARRILVHGGRHCVRRPLVLDARDNGLTIEAAPGETAVLCGGRPIQGWTCDGGRFFAATLPKIDGKPWDFRMLVVNGRFCTRARLPKTGTFTHQTEFKVRWMGTTGGGWQRKPTQQELTTMIYRPGDLDGSLDIKNAELTIYHMWDESTVGVAAMDTQTHTMMFSNPTRHPPGAFRVQKYVVWNVRQGMTEPGQWYLDRTAGRAVYWPMPGEDMARADALAPTIESIVRISGTEKAPVKGVTLRGVTLSVTNTPLVAGGFGANKFEGAVQVVHAEGCRLADLTVFNVGGQGIKTWRCSGLKVEGCHVHHTGACGIKVGGTECHVADNHVHHVGVTYPSAIGVWGSGKRVRIAHNEIHDTPYTAIACGGDEHRIESNLIYRAMQVLHDGAGIYITFCKRVTLCGNLIRDIVDTGGYGASAYYLDEQAEGCVVEKNVSVGVGWPSHNHWAKDNTIRNNVFVCDGDAKLTFPKSSGYRFERNVIRAKGKITLSNPSAIATSSNNVLFSEAGQVIGAPPGTRQAEPGVVSAAPGRFGFAPGSPAIAAGIEPVDVSAAGRLRKEKE